MSVALRHCEEHALLRLAFKVKPLSVLNSPCSLYKSSAATDSDTDVLGENVAVPSNVPEGKPGRALLSDLFNCHDPFRLSKMAAIGVMCGAIESRSSMVRCFVSVQFRDALPMCYVVIYTVSRPHYIYVYRRSFRIWTSLPLGSEREVRDVDALSSPSSGTVDDTLSCT